MSKYNKTQNKSAVLFILWVSILLIISILVGVVFHEFTKIKMVEEYPQITQLLYSNGYTNNNKKNSNNTINNPVLTSSTLSINLSSPNAILLRLEDKKVLMDKNSKNTIYPASLTKIMTAIVAIENLPTLDKIIQLPSAMFQQLYEEDASMAGFLPGEEVPAIDLLYGVLLPSGAECSVGLAEYIAGSEEEFVALMNETAKTIGMLSTHFSNTTGLHDPDHYSTVEDIALLLEYSVENDIFLDIFTSIKHSTESTNLHPDGITFYSTMFKNMDSTDILGGSILGGKTGYTSKAGLCLASLAKKNGKEYILVTAGASGNHSTEQYHISDAIYIYNNLTD